MRSVLVSLMTLLIPLSVWADPVLSESFEDGVDAATGRGWQFWKNTGLEQGAAPEGEWLLRCACGEPGSGSAAVRGGVQLKANTGYVARAMIRADGAAHCTFGLMLPGSKWLACRDVYVGEREHWYELVLPFRTEDQTSLMLYCGRRYGKGSILYDQITITEDDSVRGGDVSASTNAMPDPTDEERRRGFIVSAQSWMRLIGLVK